MVIDDSGGAPAWLVVHLLLLGAATNAIVTWTAHFASALLQQPQLSETAVVARLVALNAGVVGVLVAVSEGWRTVTIAAAALLALTLTAHLAVLVRTVRAGRTRRFAPAARFYWFAATAVLLGVSAGVTMAAGGISSAWYSRVFVTHVHLGLLGWVGLAVLGTEFSLWPTALRTRMVDGLERAAGRCLLGCAGGLALVVPGLLTWTRPLALAGLLLYAAGVVAFLDPFLRTAVRRSPREPATLMLAAGTGWLVAALAVDVIYLARDGDPGTFAADVGGIVPWLLTGFVVQVLLGALSYLVPVVLGGPPRRGKRTAAVVNRWGTARSGLLNAGALLVALPGPALTRVGWLLVAAAIVAFAALALSAAAVRARPPGGPAAQT
jgi:nitrite reductase (NO-forming)